MMDTSTFSGVAKRLVSVRVVAMTNQLGMKDLAQLFHYHSDTVGLKHVMEFCQTVCNYMNVSGSSTEDVAKQWGVPTRAIEDWEMVGWASGWSVDARNSVTIYDLPRLSVEDRTRYAHTHSTMCPCRRARPGAKIFFGLTIA